MGHLVIHDEKTFDENLDYFIRHGCPCHMDFNSKDNVEYVKWLIDMDQNLDDEFIPYGFTWKIISEDENEILKLDRYLKMYLQSKYK